MAKFYGLGIIVFVTIISTVFSTGSAFQYKVGDAEGWRLPDDNNQEMYQTWASNINFHVKDSLREYYIRSILFFFLRIKLKFVEVFLVFLLVMKRSSIFCYRILLILLVFETFFLFFL